MLNTSRLSVMTTPLGHQIGKLSFKSWLQNKGESQSLNG